MSTGRRPAQATSSVATSQGGKPSKPHTRIATPAVSVSSRSKLIVAAVLFMVGAAHALTFAPAPLPAWALAPLQIVLLGVLAAAVGSAGNVRTAAGRGFWFGFGHFAAGLYWIFISLHVYGHMAVWLSALAVMLFAAFLALFPAGAVAAVVAVTGVWQRSTASAVNSSAARGQEATVFRASAMMMSSGRATVVLLVWAAAWAASEWVRGTVLTGFPWLNIGYAHVDGPLAGWAPVLGVYGVAFAAALCAAALAGIVLWRGSPRWVALAFLITTLGLGAGLRLADWGIQPAGQPLAVRLVQGNVEQSNKFEPALIVKALEQHLQLAGQASTQPGFRPDLVLLPETAIPLFQDQVPVHLWQPWIQTAAALNAPIVTGIALHTPGPDGSSIFTNSVIGFDGDANPHDLVNARVPWRYDKSHLVPFGEFVPYGFRWFVDAMVMPMGDFYRGQRRQQPFAMAGQHIALNICYEDVFGEELLPALHTGTGGAPGATMLANVTNLGWFGDSLALPQHLQIARMRSIETARPTIRATNTGVTAIIDHHGHVRARLPQFTADVLDRYVQGTKGLTPYARMANAPTLILIVLILLGGLLGCRAYRKSGE